MQKIFEEVLEIKNGKNQKKVENPYGKYPIYGSGGIMGYADEYICGADTVVVGRKGSINKPIFVEEPFWNVDTAFGLVANKDILLPRYLYYFCQHYNFNQLSTTVTIPSLTKANLLKISIEVPTLEQQYRIVEKLETVDKIIGKMCRLKDSFDELVKSRFVEMFGDPIINSRGWKTEQAEKHIDLLSGFPFDSSKYTDNGIYICGGLIIMPQRIDWNDCKYWSSIEGYEEYILQENDIVMALDRPWISEGFKVAMIDGSHLPALLIQRTARIRAIDINQQYLFYCFIMGGFDKHCSITGSLVPHISPKDIRSFTIMLPPLDLQNQFADFVQQVDKLKVVA